MMKARATGLCIAGIIRFYHGHHFIMGICGSDNEYTEGIVQVSK